MLTSNVPKMIEKVHENRTMSSSPTTGNGNVTKKPLSFSISSILGTDDNKSSDENSTSRGIQRKTEPPRVPLTTIHHFGSEAEANYYASFESHVQPRACSTPEVDDYPSPKPFFQPFNHLNLRTDDSYLKHPSHLGDRRTPEHTDLPLKPSFKYLENSFEKNLDSMGESYNTSPSPLKMKRKKTRTVFSRSQIYQLESAFDLKRYLSSAERSGLATQLNLSETQIKIWFQNRRNKWKRQINGEMDEIPLLPAYAAGLISPPYLPSAINSYSHVRDAREELLRGSAVPVPAYYSHPYAQESRLRPAYL